MKCDAVRTALSDSFDTGQVLDGSVQAHLDNCATCAAWHAELDGLDGLLRQTTPVEDDPLLVARIQDAVARSRPWVVPRWLGAAVAMAIVVLSMAGGWVIDTYGQVSTISWAAVAPAEPLLPDWNLLRTEMVLLPMQVESELAQVSTGVMDVWTTTATWLASQLDGNSILLWGACLLGLALVIVINRHEAHRLS